MATVTNRLAVMIHKLQMESGRSDFSAISLRFLCDFSAILRSSLMDTTFRWCKS